MMIFCDFDQGFDRSLITAKVDKREKFTVQCKITDAHAHGKPTAFDIQVHWFQKSNYSEKSGV